MTPGIVKLPTRMLVETNRTAATLAATHSYKHIYTYTHAHTHTHTHDLATRRTHTTQKHIQTFAYVRHTHTPSCTSTQHTCTCMHADRASQENMTYPRTHTAISFLLFFARLEHNITLAKSKDRETCMHPRRDCMRLSY